MTDVDFYSGDGVRFTYATFEGFDLFEGWFDARGRRGPAIVFSLGLARSRA